MPGLKQFAFSLVRPIGGLQIAKFLSRNHPKILMYHRITDGRDETTLTIEKFQQHVEIIRNEFQPMTLSALMSAKERGDVPKNAVVVTFDDGYFDFGELAFPILRDANVPVTLFVTTGFVDRELWLWPDQIRHAINSTLEQELKLSAFERIFDVKQLPDETWSEIANYCLTIKNEQKLELIEELFTCLKIPLTNNAPAQYRPISWEKIQEMINDGLDVGSHSISHPVLTRLTDDKLFEELSNSKIKLELMTGKKIDTFAYPNGMIGDFDDRITKIAKECGYKYGICAYPSRDPLLNNWSINRYPAGNYIDSLIKNLYGLTYLTLKF